LAAPYYKSSGLRFQRHPVGLGLFLFRFGRDLICGPSTYEKSPSHECVGSFGPAGRGGQVPNSDVISGFVSCDERVTPERKAVLDAELGRLWGVIAAGGEFESLRGQIAQRDEELRQISGRLLSPGPGPLDADLAKIKELVMKELRDLPGLLNDDIPAART
jgi:hypothetical protein